VAGCDRPDLTGRDLIGRDVIGRDVIGGAQQPDKSDMCAVASYLTGVAEGGSA
jgi:hypothetical protein